MTIKGEYCFTFILRSYLRIIIFLVIKLKKGLIFLKDSFLFKHLKFKILTNTTALSLKYKEH